MSVGTITEATQDGRSARWWPEPAPKDDTRDALEALETRPHEIVKANLKRIKERQAYRARIGSQPQLPAGCAALLP